MVADAAGGIGGAQALLDGASQLAQHVVGTADADGVEHVPIVVRLQQQKRLVGGAADRAGTASSMSSRKCVRLESPVSGSCVFRRRSSSSASGLEAGRRNTICWQGSPS